MLRKIKAFLFGSSATRLTPSMVLMAPPELPPLPAPPPPRSSEFPMHAACKKTPDRTGAVEVLPAGTHGGAPEFDPPRSHCIGNPSTGHVISAVTMTPGELRDYCAKTPIFTPKITPPADASLTDRALFWAVFYAIREEDRGKLYEKGGIKLINETVLHAMRKLKHVLTTAGYAPPTSIEELMVGIDMKAELAKMKAEEAARKPSPEAEDDGLPK